MPLPLPAQDRACGQKSRVGLDHCLSLLLCLCVCVKGGVRAGGGGDIFLEEEPKTRSFFFHADTRLSRYGCLDYCLLLIGQSMGAWCAPVFGSSGFHLEVNWPLSGLRQA